MRQQPPVLAPLSARALVSAFTTTIRGRDVSDRLREILRDRYDADEVVLCGSGTQALQLAIAATGAPVIALPAFGCYDLASAAIGARVRVHLYDLDPKTLAPDVASVEKALHAGARAVVVTPLYGVPVEMETLERLADAYRAVVIEDAAQGIGGTLNGRRLGGIAASSIVSFGRGKGWTGGSGGAFMRRRHVGRRDTAASQNALISEATKPNAPAGTGLTGLIKAAAQWALARPSLYALPSSLPFLGLGDTVFHAPSAVTGISVAAAALLVDTAADAETAAAGRRSIGAEYARRLVGHSGAIRVPAGGEAGYVRFPLRVPDARDAVEKLRRFGVAGTYPMTLAELPELHPLLEEKSVGMTFNGAETLVRQLVTLPTHPMLSRSELDRLCADVLSFHALIP